MKQNFLTAVACFSFTFFTLCFVACPTQARGQKSDSGPAPEIPPAQSKISIENWTKPQSGWLYVLDPKPEAGEVGARIWLVDPETGKIMGSVRTGEGADFALSPDGGRLYVASILEGNTSELAVIDTTQGKVFDNVPVVGRALASGHLPPFSTMAVSGDGLALRILIDEPTSPEQDALLLATFDTKARQFLHGIVHLGNCGPGRFISYPSASHFDFLCPRTNRVRFINVDADSRALLNQDVVLPWERRIGVAQALEPPGSEAIAFVRGDGAIIQMNPGTLEFADTGVHPDLPNRIPPAAWPTSPDGSKVYLGYKNDYDREFDGKFYLLYGRAPNFRPVEAMAAQFHVLDTHTWRKIGTIKPKMPFWSAVIGNDGKTLYAMAPQNHSILVIDTERMRQTRVLTVGGAPALALVAP